MISYSKGRRSDLNLTEIHCPISHMTRRRISLYLGRKRKVMSCAEKTNRICTICRQSIQISSISVGVILFPGCGLCLITQHIISRIAPTITLLAVDLSFHVSSPYRGGRRQHNLCFKGKGPPTPV